MKTKLNTIILLLLLINVKPLCAQDTLKTRPGQVSFLYPLGTNGANSYTYSNNFSFNILYGYNGGLNGLEIGGIANINSGNVSGIQLAGIANVNQKKSNAIIFGGIANVLKEGGNLFCVGGISNYTGGSSNGFQCAGITNMTNGNLKGAQFSGIINTVSGNTIGGQFSGISNIATGNFTGIQAAGISNTIYGDLTGGQFGLLNKAKSVKGAQVGLINFASDYSKGLPVGLFSWVNGGYHALEIAGGNLFYGNANLKIGVEQFYTIYKFGYTKNKNKNHFSYGFGMGTMLRLTEKTAFSLDFSLSHITRKIKQPFFDFVYKLNVLGKTDLSFRYNLGRYFELFAGPSFNLYVASHESNSSHPPLHISKRVYRENWWNNSGSTTLFFGGNIGFSVKF